MKLTNYQRDAFVNGVMNDLPDNKVDELVHGELKAIIDRHLPKEVLAMLKNEKLRPYIESHYIGLPSGIQDMRYPVPNGSAYRHWRADLSEDILGPIDAAIAKGTKLVEERRGLQAKLEGAIKSVSTVKQALALFPEFAKYLPTETEPTKNLPAVQNLVADLTKAGWPKDRKLAKESK